MRFTILCGVPPYSKMHSLIFKINCIQGMRNCLLAFLHFITAHFFVFYCSHNAEGLVDPNMRHKKTVTGFRYPRACTNFKKYVI
jgi:hypothetical protein